MLQLPMFCPHALDIDSGNLLNEMAATPESQGGIPVVVQFIKQVLEEFHTISV